MGHTFTQGALKPFVAQVVGWGRSRIQLLQVRLKGLDALLPAVDFFKHPGRDGSAGGDSRHQPVQFTAKLADLCTKPLGQGGVLLLAFPNLGCRTLYHLGHDGRGQCSACDGINDRIVNLVDQNAVIVGADS